MTDLDRVQPSLAPAAPEHLLATPSPPDSISSVASLLVEHYESEIEALRDLQQRLDDEEMSDAALRRVIGRLMSDSHQGLAIATGFHAAIKFSEDGNEHVAQRLGDPDATIAAMQHWIDEGRMAASAVTLDLNIIASLVDRLPTIDLTAGEPPNAVIGLIQHVIEQAVAKLDRSPMPSFDAATRD